MGISIQVYRIQIGSFKSSMSNSCGLHSHRSQQRSSLLSLLSLILVVSTIGALVVHSLIENEVKFNRRSLSSVKRVFIIDHHQNTLLIDICWQTRKNLNFWARMTHGNRINRGIKLCHWNPGSADLKNKMGSIENVINKYKPHILGISEDVLYINNFANTSTAQPILDHTQ